MANKKEKEKQLQDKLQIILADLLKDDDNKYCADCDSKGPRWASWTLGIFLCIRCAGIHRNLGVHLSRVKSVNLDSWTPQQVAMLKEIGNSRGRAIYEANLEDNFRRPQTDSGLEQFIRAKYEQKRYIAKEWIAPTPSVDSIADEIRKLEQNQNKKRVNYNVNNTVNNSIVPISRRENSEKSISGIKTLEMDEKPQNNSNKVDLLGLESENGTNNVDDAFGDFVFASPHQPFSPSTSLSNCVTTSGGSLPVSSAVEDLMGLNLESSGLVTNMSIGTATGGVNVCVSSPSSVQNAAGGKLDKSSILALYNSNSSGGNTMSQVPNSLAGWSATGAGSSTLSYQTGFMQSDFPSQGYKSVGGSSANWIGPGQAKNTNSFEVQHNPFFNNSNFSVQQTAMPLSQSTFPSNFPSGSTQPSNRMLW